MTKKLPASGETDGKKYYDRLALAMSFREGNLIICAESVELLKRAFAELSGYPMNETHVRSVRICEGPK